MKFIFITWTILLSLGQGVKSRHHVSLNKTWPLPPPLKIIIRSQMLSPVVKLQWMADIEKNTIRFRVTAKTSGAILFGLSPTRSLLGGDFILGGVDDFTRKPYFADYTGAIESVTQDASQDWFLLGANQIGGMTTLKFTRALVTCDRNDVDINDNMLRVIWYLSEADTLGHRVDNGQLKMVDIYLLDPTIKLKTEDLKEFDLWNVVINTTMPSVKTSYYCTFHKSPLYESRRHIIGYRIKLYNEEARKHNHHIIFHKCDAAPGSPAEKLLELHTNGEGGLCYFNDGSNVTMAMTHCTSYLFGWAVGAEDVFFPPDVGVPLNEGGRSEYYAVEIHRDNPEEVSGLSYFTGVEIFTTENLREKEAGTFDNGHYWSPSLLIPPKSEGFKIVGHCSSDCTAANIPPEGITILNCFLHSHLAGRKLKVRHFRPTAKGYFKELPWICSDDNYNFLQQKSRHLKQFVTILPEDRLITECTYNNTWRSTATVEGLATESEMCSAYLLYYPKMESGMHFCGSEQIFYPPKRFGIQEIDRSTNLPTIVKPSHLANETYEGYVTKSVKWTKKMRTKFQESVRYRDHVDICVNTQTYKNFTRDWKIVKYPTFYDTYQPHLPHCGLPSTPNIRVSVQMTI